MITMTVGDKSSMKKSFFNPGLPRTHGVSLQLYQVIQKKRAVIGYAQRAYHGLLDSGYNIGSAVSYANSSRLNFERMTAKSRKSLRLSRQLALSVGQIMWTEFCSGTEHFQNILNEEQPGSFDTVSLKNLSEHWETWKILFLKLKGEFIIERPTTKLLFDSGWGETFEMESWMWTSLTSSSASSVIVKHLLS